MAKAWKECPNSFSKCSPNAPTPFPLISFTPILLWEWNWAKNYFDFKLLSMNDCFTKYSLSSKIESLSIKNIRSVLRFSSSANSRTDCSHEWRKTPRSGAGRSSPIYRYGKGILLVRNRIWWRQIPGILKVWNFHLHLAVAWTSRLLVVAFCFEVAPFNALYGLLLRGKVLLPMYELSET